MPRREGASTRMEGPAVIPRWPRRRKHQQWRIYILGVSAWSRNIVLFHLHGQEAEIPESVLTVWGCTCVHRGLPEDHRGLPESCEED